MTKMNESVKAQWVAALRSGKYKQGQDQLKDGDRFCCLGVACAEYAKALCKPWRTEWLGDGDNLLPGGEVITWAGWDSHDPSVEIDGFRRPLSRHNDLGVSFAEIADAIEAQL